MKRRISKWVVGLLFVIIAGLFYMIPCGAADTSTDPTQAEQSKPVKIGYAELPGFLYVDENGTYAGVAYELLQEIAQYTGWRYEYVEMTYYECKQALEEGKIDLFIPYQKTPEREAQFEYGSMVFCTNQGSLLTRPDSDLYYNDFEHFNGITIGVVQDTRNGERFMDFLSENNCNVNLRKDYTTIDQLQDALDRGEIDAFISASQRGLSNCKIICTLPETDSYAIAKKGDKTYLKQMDQALIQIQNNTPSLKDELDQKYRLTSDDVYPSFTRQEEEYIQNADPITLIVGPRDYDFATKQAKGNTGILVDMLAEKTGLTFRVISADTSNDVYTNFAAGQSDIMIFFDRNYEWADLHNATLTMAYAEYNNKVITRQKDQKRNTVALVEGTYIAYYVERNMQYNSIQYYTSYKEAIRAVKSGKADVAYCNALMGNYYSTFPEFNSLNFVSTYDFVSEFCTAVSKSSDPILVGILNKTVSCIPDKTFASMLQDRTYTKSNSIMDLIYTDPVAVAVLAVLVVLLIAMLIFNWIYKKQKRKLLIANQAKRDFLSRMSHEIRTPMSTLMGLTQLARQETDHPQEMTEYVNEMDSTSQYLMGIINDVLDMSRIEMGKFTLNEEWTNPGTVVKFTLQMFASQIEAKRIHFEYDNECSISTQREYKLDTLRCRQILMNVLNNALKFTPEGGTISFHDEHMRTEGDIAWEKFIVSDTGCGMSEDFMKRIFAPFEQEHNTFSDSVQGTGLGLAIVKQIVDAMNGTISVESELGKGSKFIICLPFHYREVEEGREEEIDRQEPESMDDTALRGMHILVAEDHALNAEIIRRLLRAKGCLVELAENGQRAVEKFEKSNSGTYDVILMDVRMPIMDGLQASKTIRKLERSDAKTIRIIAMTADAFTEAEKRTKEAGMDAHLTKPIDPPKLFKTLIHLTGDEESI